MARSLSLVELKEEKIPLADGFKLIFSRRPPKVDFIDTGKTLKKIKPPLIRQAGIDFHRDRFPTECSVGFISRPQAHPERNISRGKSRRNPAGREESRLSQRWLFRSFRAIRYMRAGIFYNDFSGIESVRPFPGMISVFIPALVKNPPTGSVHDRDGQGRDLDGKPYSLCISNDRLTKRSLDMKMTFLDLRKRSKDIAKAPD